MTDRGPEETETERSVPRPRLDFLSGLAFVGLGLFMVVKSWNMPRLEHRDVSVYTVPGVVPGLLGCVILVLGAILAVRAAVAGGLVLRGKGDSGGSVLRRPDTVKLLLTLVLTLSYAGLLVGRIAFEAATFAFVTLFVLVFEWNRDPATRPAFSGAAEFNRMLDAAFGKNTATRIWTAAVALLLAAAVTVAVSYIFQEIFRIRLP